MLVGGEVLILLGPEHAATIAKDGFSKEDVKKFLFQEARLPLDFIPAANWDSFRRMRPQAEEFFERRERLPVVDRWQDIQVAVAGGAGKHSVFIPTFGSTQSITRAIALKDGRPARSIKEFVSRKPEKK